jgi:hypothetical protein
MVVLHDDVGPLRAEPREEPVRRDVLVVDRAVAGRVLHDGHRPRVDVAERVREAGGFGTEPVTSTPGIVVSRDARPSPAITGV